MKTVFTTGEAAKIAKVSQQTIIRCFDNGQLRGFRVPGSKFRRIPRESLYKFLKDNGIPTDGLGLHKRKLLLVDDAAAIDAMMAEFAEDARFDVRIASSGFDAGMMAKEFCPDVIVLGIQLPDADAAQVCTRLRGTAGLEDLRIICVGDAASVTAKEAALKLVGADLLLARPYEEGALLEAVEAQLELEPTALA